MLVITIQIPASVGMLYFAIIESYYYQKLRSNPPLKEVSAGWRTEEVVQFISSETAQHPSDLTQVFDRSPFEGRFVSFMLFRADVRI